MARELFADLLARIGMVSLQSLLLVAMIGLIGRLWPRLPAATRCTLWWLASMQLVIGLLWPAPLELRWLSAPSATTATIEHAAAPIPAPVRAGIPEPMPAAGEPAPAQSATGSTTESARPLPWTGVLAWLWLMGVVMTALQTMHAYQQARRWRRNSYACDDDALLALYHRTGRALGLGTLPPLRMARDIASPQLLGPWRPMVLLPADAPTRFSEAELRMALHHELSHYRRRDLWWGWMPALARHLFFFHPAAHLIAREYALAREAACDEAVLSCDHHSAHEYGRLLLQLGVAPRPCAGLASASPTYTLLKRRLTMLQNTGAKPHLVPMVLLAALVAVAVLPYRVVAGTDRATPAAQPRVSATATPAAHAAPAPRTSATAAAAPVARAASVARPAASTAPSMAASVARTSTPSRTIARSTDGDGYAYVLMEGDHVTANAESDDFKAARQARGDSRASMLWARHGGQAYAIRDAAVIQRALDLWKPSHALGEQQAQLGSQQAALGKKQAELGQQMARLGSQMASIGAEHASIASRHAALALSDDAQAERQQAAIDREVAVLDKRQDELSRQQSELGRQQSGLGSQQSVLGEKQAALGERQAEESDRAHRQMQQLIDDAIARGIAQPVAR